MQLQPSRFEHLGDAFFTRLPPTPLPAPHWVAHSPALALTLGLPADWLQQDTYLNAFTGNAVLPGSSSLATVYSGHQFGVWAGQLGDGRALLLGDAPSNEGLQEIQLKGAGLTPYSRMGDGRAVLRSSIREFLASEAMHALGIPTTRALCITGSPAPVYREEVETAAVVTRVAPSFIRFGHFEHFSYSGQHGELRQLADFVIDHFYPECRQAETASANAYAALLAAVTHRTAELVAQWQAVGFCHGVMNTDNMSILGLTLDYGPFQFLDAFDPGHICNHSDHSGRYSYARQPNIAYWNLFCLGQALLPLIGEPENAVAQLETYRQHFPAALKRRMNAKLGLRDALQDDTALLEDLLRLLTADRVDWTIFWHRLGTATADMALAPVRDLFIQRDAFDGWAARWRQRLQADSLQQEGCLPACQALMLASNPYLVLRNHLGEIAIRHAQQGEFGPVQRLLSALQAPYTVSPEHADLADFPPDWASGISISCSS
ncbi:MAG TPA: YdiU family protein [Macromonas sp.]|nr:YdiU family protein [Macromonas sp.]